MQVLTTLQTKLLHTSHLRSMRDRLANLKSLLGAVVDGSASRQQQSELVHHSRTIIEAYLKHQRSSVTQLCLHHGFTITDLAYDCLGEAFGRNDIGGFPQLQHFADSLNSPLDDILDHELFLAFKGFLTAVTNAQLARLYVQADSARGKIHRNIQETIKKGRTPFSLTKDYRGYVLIPLKIETLDTLPPYPYDELQQGFLLHARSHFKIPDMLSALWKALDSQTQYRRSLTLVQVVQLFTTVYKAEEPKETDRIFDPANNGLTNEELEHVCRQIGQTIQQQIVLTYLVHGKLERHQAEGLANALRDYLLDFCFSEDKRTSLYCSVNKYLRITEEEYEETLRTKAEYLLKLAKDELAARLMKEL